MPHELLHKFYKPNVDVEVYRLVVIVHKHTFSFVTDDRIEFERVQISKSHEILLFTCSQSL